MRATMAETFVYNYVSLEKRAVSVYIYIYIYIYIYM